jgi:hypothetical protein
MSSAERKQGLIPVLTHPTGDQQQATERVAGHFARYQLPQFQRRLERSTSVQERPKSCSDSPANQYSGTCGTGGSSSRALSRRERRSAYRFRADGRWCVWREMPHRSRNARNRRSSDIRRGDRDTIAWTICMTTMLSVNKRMNSPCLRRQCSTNSCRVNLTVISS